MNYETPGELPKQSNTTYNSQLPSDVSSGRLPQIEIANKGRFMDMSIHEANPDEEDDQMNNNF